MKKFFIGFGIYFNLFVIVLGICGIYPLILVGIILAYILHITVTDKMTKDEIIECMGGNWMESNFKFPLFKDLTKDE